MAVGMQNAGYIVTIFPGGIEEDKSVIGKK